MARVFAYLSNQADRQRCALTLDGPTWAASEPAGEPPKLSKPSKPDDGWGAGSYQHGEVLLRRRPVEGAIAPSPAVALSELRTDCAVMHVRGTDLGVRTPENTPPFRFRDWLCALQGPSLAPREASRARAAMLARAPSFLVQSTRGDTPDEAVFALFLSALHARGRLDDPDVDRATVAACCVEALRHARAACESEGVAPIESNLVATNRRILVAHRAGPLLAWFRRHGVRDCAACRRPADISGSTPRTLDHEHLKYLFVLGDAQLPPRWSEVPAGATLTSDLALDVRVLES